MSYMERTQEQTGWFTGQVYIELSSCYFSCLPTARLLLELKQTIWRWFIQTLNMSTFRHLVMVNVTAWWTTLCTWSHQCKERRLQLTHPPSLQKGISLSRETTAMGLWSMNIQLRMCMKRLVICKHCTWPVLLILP